MITDRIMNILIETLAVPPKRRTAWGHVDERLWKNGRVTKFKMLRFMIKQKTGNGSDGCILAVHSHTLRNIVGFTGNDGGR